MNGMTSRYVHGCTYQKRQKHGYRLNTAVIVVWLDEDGDRVAGEEVGNGEADGPANNKHENDVYDDLELSHGENVLVHDENGRLDQAKSDDRDHV